LYRGTSPPGTNEGICTRANYALVQMRWGYICPPLLAPSSSFFPCLVPDRVVTAASLSIVGRSHPELPAGVSTSLSSAHPSLVHSALAAPLPHAPRRPPRHRRSSPPSLHRPPFARPPCCTSSTPPSPSPRVVDAVPSTHIVDAVRHPL
jgi:hypothetical protein